MLSVIYQQHGHSFLSMGVVVAPIMPSLPPPIPACQRPVKETCVGDNSCFTYTSMKAFSFFGLLISITATYS